MKILITGTSGFIGSNLMNYYRQLGHQVYGPGRHDPMQFSLEKFQPDLIINSAAEIYNTVDMLTANVSSVQTLIAWCQHNPATRLIQIGSSSEYGPNDAVTAETTPARPIDCYGASKLAATVLCQAWAQQHNLDIVVVRLYSPYGPGERAHRLFPRFWQAFELGREMNLVNGVHDFTYIEDVVAAIDSVAKSPDRTPGEIINICSGQQHSNYTIWKIFEAQTGKKAPVTFDPRFVTPRVWIGDNTVLTNKYHWQPKFDIFAGIDAFVQRACYE
jgi:nucleoside-diphosphate-sugar epimerase